MKLFNSLSNIPWLNTRDNPSEGRRQAFYSQAINVYLLDGELDSVSVRFASSATLPHLKHLGEVLESQGVVLDSGNTKVDFTVLAYVDSNGEACEDCGEFPKNEYNIYLDRQDLICNHDFGCYNVQPLLNADIANPLPVVFLSNEEEDYQGRVNEVVKVAWEIGRYLEANGSEEA